jgi:hypothetical protein
MASQTHLSLLAALSLAWASTAVAQQTPSPEAYEHGKHHGKAHHGMGGGPVSMLTRRDAASEADMALVHQLLDNHTRIRRTVTRLPDGFRAVTESDDPATVQIIQAHVASMSQRLKDGREFNIFSNTLPILFEQREKIVSSVAMTAKGAAVTRTSSDPAVAAALQGHAGEVSTLAREGHTAMHRGMQSRMAAMAGKPPAQPANAVPAKPADHVH